MALAGIPPWESVNPLDFVNAAQSGARLGLERAGQTLGAEEASDRLGLAYAQLQAENARHAASIGAQQQAAATGLAQWQQEMGLKKQQADVLDQYRAGELQSRAIRDALALAAAKRNAEPAPMPEIQYADVGGRKFPYLVDKKTGRGTWAPAGAFTAEKPGSLTPVQREQLRQLRADQAALRKKYDAATIQANERMRGLDPNNPKFKAYDADMARLKDIEKQINSILTVSPAPNLGTGAGGAPGALPAPGQGEDENDPVGILPSTNAPPSPNE